MSRKLFRTSSAVSGLPSEKCRPGGTVTSTVSGNVTGRYVRIRNTAAKNVWWRVAEITVTPPETADPLKSVYTNKTQHG